jgi:hypothetical protein
MGKSKARGRPKAGVVDTSKKKAKQSKEEVPVTQVQSGNCKSNY